MTYGEVYQTIDSHEAVESGGIFTLFDRTRRIFMDIGSIIFDMFDDMISCTTHCTIYHRLAGLNTSLLIAASRRLGHACTHICLYESWTETQLISSCCFSPRDLVYPYVKF